MLHAAWAQRNKSKERQAGARMTNSHSHDNAGKLGGDVHVVDREAAPREAGAAQGQRREQHAPARGAGACAGRGQDKGTWGECTFMHRSQRCYDCFIFLRDPVYAPQRTQQQRQQAPRAPAMSISATAALQKPAVLTSLRPAATLRRRTLITQSPAQPPALEAANMSR